MALPPANPFFAFVELSIGEMSMTRLPPEHLLQFTYTRKPMNAANKFIISLFDETALMVEYWLIRGYQDVKFQYGYVGGQVSPVYSGTITEYDVDFSPAGAVLNVEGLSSAISAFSKPVTKTYKDMKIHEIVKDIAKDEGWIEGNIVECSSVADGDNPDKVFTRNNQAAPIFITNELIPYAKSSETGDSNFILNFEDSAEGTKINFYPAIQANKNSDSVEHLYEFQWGSGDRNSQVISFNPDYSGTLRLMSGGAVVEADTIDKIANEMFSITYDSDTDANRTVLDSKSPYDYSGAKKIIGGSSYTKDEMRNIAAYLWYTNSTYPVNAELTIMGDSGINAFDTVSVVMLNKDGLPHHSSGVYLVKEIEDDIAGGSYITKMSLFKNAMSIGVDESGGINVTISSDYTANAVTDSVGDSTPVTTSGPSTSNLVNIALSQKGNKGGQKFWSWYGGFTSRVHWCAIFVSWCCEQAGVLGSQVTKYAGCITGVKNFKARGTWRPAGSYIPKPGDIIFFDHDYDSGHTGIVVSCDGTTVRTIEGNTSDMVAERSYNMANPSRRIAGYGVVNA